MALIRTGGNPTVTSSIQGGSGPYTVTGSAVYVTVFGTSDSGGGTGPQLDADNVRQTPIDTITSGSVVGKYYKLENVSNVELACVGRMTVVTIA